MDERQVQRAEQRLLRAVGGDMDAQLLVQLICQELRRGAEYREMGRLLIHVAKRSMDGAIGWSASLGGPLVMVDFHDRRGAPRSVDQRGASVNGAMMRALAQALQEVADPPD